MNLNDSISIVKNIGKTRTTELNKLGIETVEDLIQYFPRDYEDRSKYVELEDLELNEINTFKAKVSSRAESLRVKSMTIVKVRLTDKTNTIEAAWYNQPYIKNAIAEGKEYIFTGKVVKKYGRLQVENPDFEIYGNESLNMGRIVPIYTLPKKMSQKTIRSSIKNALDELDEGVIDFFPKDIIEKSRLCNRNFAISNIHFPADDNSFFMARRRLVFEELLMLQMYLLQLKSNVVSKITNIKIRNFGVIPILDTIGFKLTTAQEKVLKEVFDDIKNGSVVNRLIQGDVGSGKTAIAMIVAYLMINNGYQVALMAPTDVLANQHYISFEKVFKPLGIKCQILTSGLKKKDKDKAYDNIKSGNVSMIIGTHALIQDKVIYNNIGLVITDEQHRFGVSQRESLSKKGETPHTLVMSATPIPRTLALILYGDLDISIIDSLPPNRKKVDTFLVNSTYYKRLYKFIGDEVKNGRQAYIICPMIEENDKMELRSVLSYTQELKNDIFPDLKVEYIHGKMKNDEKQSIMDLFSKGDIDILVSTTVIEVGINVPNATLMIIENAERFGLSALHQLRGRVGRGSEKSYCILISEAKNKTSKERLDIMCKTNDGFVVSEKDLLLRGPGDFFGTRQHGLPEMKIANLYKDVDILKEVQKIAIDMYKNDEKLESNENFMLKSKIFELFEKNSKKMCL